jgi:hypothetical protein
MKHLATLALIVFLSTPGDLWIQNESETEGGIFYTPAQETLHRSFDDLLRQHVSEDGRVDYKAFQQSHYKLQEYIEDLTKAYGQLDTMSRNETLAYWINAYNALTIDLVLRHYPIKSIKDLNKPWKQALWKFGDSPLSLNDIEHAILRKMDEPRIHFVIVCASKSCPALPNKAFTGRDLNEQLDKATKNFINDEHKNRFYSDKAELSRIFKWFSKDFQNVGGVLSFIRNYKDIPEYKPSQLGYRTYNWDLNE